MMLSSTHGVMANANAIRAGTITLAVLMSTNAAAPMAFWPSESPRSGALPVEAHTVPYAMGIEVSQKKPSVSAYETMPAEPAVLILVIISTRHSSGILGSSMKPSLIFHSSKSLTSTSIWNEWGVMMKHSGLCRWGGVGCVAERCGRSPGCSRAPSRSSRPSRPPPPPPSAARRCCSSAGPVMATVEGATTPARRGRRREVSGRRVGRERVMRDGGEVGGSGKRRNAVFGRGCGALSLPSP
mmetsp:Transcript_34880/g.93230  ORF Transcript_34880/g.93230 Transcript_34880/m.93230 type:complete len:241 (-) Transcript_34880:584-1306(-)